MKNVLVLTLVAASIGAFSLSAHADFDCKSVPDGTYGVVVNTDTGGTARVTISRRGTAVYKDVAAAEISESAGTTYISPTFTNANHAKSSLYVRFYLENGKSVGDFSETSFLPTVPNLILDCGD